MRLFVPANANNWACAAAQQFHHDTLLDAGVRILEYPTMLHAKAFVRDGEELLAGTCTLEAWSLQRFFEIDLRLRSTAVAAPFDERFSTPAEAVSSPGRALTGRRERCASRAACDRLAAALIRGWFAFTWVKALDELSYRRRRREFSCGRATAREDCDNRSEEA